MIYPLKMISFEEGGVEGLLLNIMALLFGFIGDRRLRDGFRVLTQRQGEMFRTVT
jgi:hypothetical protein